MSPPFCRAAKLLNMTNIWITPFLRVTTGPITKRKIRKFIDPFIESGKPVVMQIMGTDPQLMIETANRAKTVGVAGINFNLACPSLQVVRGGCGAALLQDHSFIKELLKLSVDLQKEISVSLKIRSGLNSPLELASIAKSIMVTPPDFIVLHYRTAKEGYRAVSGRNERIKEAVEQFKGIPLIANGDIESYSEAKRVVRDTGCAGVMVARGWLKNPNLIRDIATQKESTIEEQHSALSQFIYNMAMDIAGNKLKRSKNAILDVMRYAVGTNHPLFRYTLNIKPDQLQRQLSVAILKEYLRKG